MKKCVVCFTHDSYMTPVLSNRGSLTFFMISCSLGFCMSTINSGFETILESISGVIPVYEGGVRRVQR